MVDEHADMKPELEEAFFLGYPDLLTYKSIGYLVSLFEDENLKLKGMRLMHVNKSFIKKHFENAGIPEGEHRYTLYNSWDVYLTCRPVVAMILEGDDAVHKVKNITSNKKNESLFGIKSGPKSYISKSAPEATRDIELWFRKDSEGWLNEMIESKDLIYVHPDKSDGPWESAFDMLRNDVMCDPKPDLQQYFDMAKMSVVVIKPKAFGEYCVGEILRAVEVNGCGIRGLKLVRKAECPASDVWSDSCTSSESGVNDYALAMVVDYLRPGLELLHDEPDAKHFDFSSRVCRVGSFFARMDDEHADKKPEVQDAFFLGYPDLVNRLPMGEIVSLFEEQNLMLKGMRLMHVNERFIKKHFENSGVPKGENRYTWYNSWESYLAWRPVVAMILEGDDAVDKVRQLILDEESSLFWDDGPTSYISQSPADASRDIELWFREDCKGWLNKDEISASKDLIYVHLDDLCGPWELAYDMLWNDVMCDPQPDLQRYYTMAKMSVLVIKPKAFGEKCVGEILRAVEFSSVEVRGLKVVRKDECPESAVWSCETDSDEPALAIVASFLSPKFELTHDKPDAKDIDFSSEAYRVGSNYIYKSEADTLRRDMKLFFPYGLVLWVDPECCDNVCGNIFEASLIGLKTQD